VVPAGVLKISGAGRTVKASLEAPVSRTISVPDEALMHFVTADYPLRRGERPSPVGVVLSAAGVLVIRVTPQMSASMGERGVALIGMMIAKARPNVKPAQVTGVVMQLHP